MEVSMTTLLVSLCLKTALNCVVLLVQTGHVGRSFIGVFSASLALADALLHLSVSCVFLLRDVQAFGLRLTRYHVCAAVQAACSVQAHLHWPVFVLSALDVLWSSRTSCRRPAPTLLRAAAALLLWTSSASYVFNVPDSHPITGDRDDLATLQLCHVTGGTQSRQVAWASLLTPLGVACYVVWFGGTLSEQLRACLGHFLSTWSAFLLLLLFVVASGTDVPPYLELNGVWLGFVHSLHTAAALRPCACIFCAHTPDDAGTGRTRHTHASKAGLPDQTPPAQTLHTRRLA